MVANCALCDVLVLRLPTLLARVELNSTPGEGRWSIVGPTARFTGKGLYTNHALTCRKQKWKKG